MISYGIILKSKIIYLFTYKQFLYNFVTFYIKIFKQISKELYDKFTGEYKCTLI